MLWHDKSIQVGDLILAVRPAFFPGAPTVGFRAFLAQQQSRPAPSFADAAAPRGASGAGPVRPGFRNRHEGRDGRARPAGHHPDDNSPAWLRLRAAPRHLAHSRNHRAPSPLRLWERYRLGLAMPFGKRPVKMTGSVRSPWSSCCPGEPCAPGWTWVPLWIRPAGGLAFWKRSAADRCARPMTRGSSLMRRCDLACRVLVGRSSGPRTPFPPE